jgi:hypothetical protein
MQLRYLAMTLRVVPAVGSAIVPLVVTACRIQVESCRRECLHFVLQPECYVLCDTRHVCHSMQVWDSYRRRVQRTRQLIAEEALVFAIGRA